MKVRHKQTGIVTEVIGFVPAHEYEIARDPNVPVTEWRDVTEACCLNGHAQYVRHNDCEVIHCEDGNYRLVKERLYRDLDGRMSNIKDHSGWCAQTVWAFRVERKV